MVYLYRVELSYLKNEKKRYLFFTTTNYIV